MKREKRYRRALRGLRGITLWIHDVDDTATNDGLSRQHLQDEVTVRLLDRGIRTLGIGNVPEPPGNPWLNVFILTMKLKDTYTFFITVRLDEIARLDRNNSIKTVVTTWETSINGCSEVSQMPLMIEKNVDKLIDYFIYDYQFENSH